MQFCMDLPLQECSRGAAFTMVEGELQISSKLLASHLKPSNLSLRDFIAQGNKVVVVGYQRGRAKPTGRLYEIEFVHLWSVRDGKISEFWVYTDTVALVEALRR